MTIEKLASGSYRIKQMYKGKTYRLTVPSKPTKAQAQLLIDEHIKAQGIVGTSEAEQLVMNFNDAMTAYNHMKEPVLSPSTIKDYYNMPNRIPEWFKNLKVREITLYDMQKCINELTPGRSQKTIKNMNGYMQSVIKAFRGNFGGFKIDILPTVKEEPYIPTADEVKRIVSASIGTPYEMTIALACFGLRRSEAAAITSDDLNGNILKIDKALVQNKDKEWVIKPYPKTTESIRTVVIDSDLAKMIKEKGKVCDFHPGDTLRWLHKTCDELGIQRFQLHKMRHWVATELSQKGLPEADILKFCGWSPRGDVMKTIYRHSRIQSEKEKAQQVSNTLSSLFRG